jgi:RNA polymerase sigma-70 factor (ECF subfamily)
MFARPGNAPEIAFQQHFPSVFRFIARRVGTTLAEDLAAETFATAFRRRASFEPGRGTLRSWLYGIATDLVRNHWRAEQHLLALDARILPGADLSDNSDAIDQPLTAALLAPRLAAALGLLSRDQRDVPGPAERADPSRFHALARRAVLAYI